MPCSAGKGHAQNSAAFLMLKHFLGHAEIPAAAGNAARAECTGRHAAKTDLRRRSGAHSLHPGVLTIHTASLCCWGARNTSPALVCIKKYSSAQVASSLLPVHTGAGPEPQLRLDRVFLRDDVFIFHGELS